MGQHSIAPGHPRLRSSTTCAALAAGAIFIALLNAGTAEAKTHHGAGAPGNPYGTPQIGTPGSGGASFTTIRVTRSPQGGVSLAQGLDTSTGEIVSGSGNTTVRSSGGRISGSLGGPGGLGLTGGAGNNGRAGAPAHGGGGPGAINTAETGAGPAGIAGSGAGGLSGSGASGPSGGGGPGAGGQGKTHR